MEILVENNLRNIQFNELFFNDDKCLQLLSELKWANGFVCRKCGNENFCDGKIPHSRRCTRCKNEESATANTLFHNIKFPVGKAFNIACQVCFSRKNLSSYDLSKRLELRQMTCWKFKHKIENKIARIVNLNDSKSVSFIEVLVGNNVSPFL